MFVRASRRSFQKDARRQSIPNIDLPQLLFLCPVLLSQPIHRRETSTASRSRPVRGLKNTRANNFQHVPSNASTHRRTLASAAAQSENSRQLIVTLLVKDAIKSSPACYCFLSPSNSLKGDKAPPTMTLLVALCV